MPRVFETRSLRLRGGHNTTVRLEREFWDYLARISKYEEEKLNDLLNIILQDDAEDNRSGRIRLWIAQYLFKIVKKYHAPFSGIPQ